MLTKIVILELPANATCPTMFHATTCPGFVQCGITPGIVCTAHSDVDFESFMLVARGRKLGLFLYGGVVLGVHGDGKGETARSLEVNRDK